MDIAKKFGRTVRNERKKLGLSQEKLAELAGIHRTYMGSIERGERNICVKNIEKLAKALNMPVGQLMHDL